jgi:hypothetical protein
MTVGQLAHNPLPVSPFLFPVPCPLHVPIASAFRQRNWNPTGDSCSNILYVMVFPCHLHPICFKKCLSWSLPEQVWDGRWIWRIKMQNLTECKHLPAAHLFVTDSLMLSSWQLYFVWEARGLERFNHLFKVTEILHVSASTLILDGRLPT